MANTIKIKRSSTASGVPTSLDYGELAINYADGKIFYKNSSDQIKSFEGIGGSANYVVYRNSSGVLTGSSGFQYDGVSIKVNGNIESVYSNGDEGGEIFLNKPATNTTITNGVTIDIFQNKLRFFENGGTSRGYYIDITSGGASASTNLVGSGSGTVTSITAGTGLSGRNNNNFWNYSHRLYCCNFNWVSNFNEQNPYLTSY